MVRDCGHRAIPPACRWSLCQEEKAHRPLLRRPHHLSGLQTAEFLRRASDVNYRAIYQALEAIENSEIGDTCPACLTPLDRVSVNPFERARHELQALSALEQLKHSKRRNDERIALLASRVATGLTIVKANVQAGVPCVLPTDHLQAALSDFHAATDRAEVASVVLRLFLELQIEKHLAWTRTGAVLCGESSMMCGFQSASVLTDLT